MLLLNLWSAARKGERCEPLRRSLMKITFYYVCDCGCHWDTTQFIKSMSFLDSSCLCPSCGEENMAEEQKLS